MGVLGWLTGVGMGGGVSVTLDLWLIRPSSSDDVLGRVGGTESVLGRISATEDVLGRVADEEDVVPFVG